jgi:hypothetical protein
LFAGAILSGTPLRAGQEARDFGSHVRAIAMAALIRAHALEGCLVGAGQRSDDSV